MTLRSALTVLLALALGAPLAVAKVTEEEAARLGKDLTPLGAEVAGEGDVPAWTGGLTGVPTGIVFDPKTQHPPNPFPDDRPKYTITKQNMADYDALLTDGHKAMLKRVPGFKMNVYQSRRSCTVPKFAQEATKRNATTAELTADGEGVTGGSVGTPFPIPQSAKELMWNHRLRYAPNKMVRYLKSVRVKVDGSHESIQFIDQQLNQWISPIPDGNIYIFRRTVVTAPMRIAGIVDLAHEPVSGFAALKKLWQYSPITRRVRRAPDISYDNPGTITEGLSTVDSLNGFDGPLDRYDWSSTGRLVRLVPYNSYILASMKLDKLLARGSLNSDALHYEPHRMWVVQAMLRADQNHAYHRRVMYLDEDTYAVLAAELYDSRGRLWRLQEIHTINHYRANVCLPVADVVYDLKRKSGYLVGSLINDMDPLNIDEEINPARFAPEAVRMGWSANER